MGKNSFLGVIAAGFTGLISLSPDATFNRALDAMEEEFRQRQVDADAIKLLSSSEWLTDDGIHESRYHIGHSANGFHFAVDYAVGGGVINDSEEFGWSRAYASQREAESQAHVEAYSFR